MASLYKRPNSGYWWIKYRSSRGKITQESTKFKRDVPTDTRRARTYCAEKTLQELKRSRTSQKERWEFWVSSFLNMRYQNSPKTLQRYNSSWRSLFAFLQTREIHYPSQLSYTDCVDYLDWRKKGDRASGVHKAGHNTAVLELKLIHLIMTEAIRRGFAAVNPAAKLGIERIKPKEKPEIPDEDIAKIRQALQSEPEWMRIAFEIGLYTGCRLRETCVGLSDVNLAARTIYFPNPKGGRPFSVPMRDELVPLFERLIKEGRTRAYEMPRMPSKEWWQFFKKIGMPQYCFHCLRVSFVSRGVRAGVDEREMMRLVNHASTTIHRVYQRFRVDDLRTPLRSIPLPSMAEIQGSP